MGLGLAFLPLVVLTLSAGSFADVKVNDLWVRAIRWLALIWALSKRIAKVKFLSISSGKPPRLSHSKVLNPMHTMFQMNLISTLINHVWSNEFVPLLGTPSNTIMSVTNSSLLSICYSGYRWIIFAMLHVFLLLDFITNSDKVINHH